MTTITIVEPLDVLEHLSSRFSSCAIPLTMNALVLQAVEETFGGRIVPAVALATHRAAHCIVGQLGLKGFTGILHASVGVMKQPWRRPAPKPSHAQRITSQPSGEILLQRPAHDFAVKEVQHH